MLLYSLAFSMTSKFSPNFNLKKAQFKNWTKLVNEIYTAVQIGPYATIFVEK